MDCQTSGKKASTVNSVNNSDRKKKTGSHVRDTNTGSAIELKGRRLIDFAYFFDQVKELDSHSSRNGGCSFNTMECVKEVRRGLNCFYSFRCTKCGFEKEIASSRNDTNAVAALASQKSGIGLQNAERIWACLGIPVDDKVTESTPK